MEHLGNFKAQAAVEPVHWLHDGDHHPDLESAVLLRGLVLPAFETAKSWSELAESLECIGFGLSIKDGHLTLVDTDHRAGICTGRFLGKPLVELSGKLGKPIIRATLSGDACGEIVF